MDIRGGRLPAPKARKPARYLTTPFSQLPVGRIMDGVPLDPAGGQMTNTKRSLYLVLTNNTDSYGCNPCHSTPTHSQRARGGREPAYANSHIPEARGTWKHHRSRPTNSQSTKAPSIQVVSWVNMGLGHSNDDLRARNAAPQPQRGGVYERHAGVPCSQRGARRGG